MKLRVQYEGKEIEVDVPDDAITAAVADTHVPKTFMQSEIKRRLATATKNLVSPEDVLEDQEFRETALKAWGFGKGAKKLDDDDIAKLKKQFVDNELKPVQARAEKAEAKIAKMAQSQLQLEIINAAREAGVRKEWLTPPSAGLKAPIVSMVEGYFGQSPDHEDGWFLKDGEGFAYAKEPKPQSPYKGVGEFISEFVNDASRSATFLAEPQRVGAPTARVGVAKPATNGVVSGAASDPMVFGHNLEAIAKGAKVQ